VPSVLAAPLALALALQPAAAGPPGARGAEAEAPRPPDTLPERLRALLSGLLADLPSLDAGLDIATTSLSRAFSEPWEDGAVDAALTPVVLGLHQEGRGPDDPLLGQMQKLLLGADAFDELNERHRRRLLRGRGRTIRYRERLILNLERLQDDLAAVAEAGPGALSRRAPRLARHLRGLESGLEGLADFVASAREMREAQRAHYAALRERAERLAAGSPELHRETREKMARMTERLRRLGARLEALAKAGDARLARLREWLDESRKRAATIRAELAGEEGERER
jgi:hypothetical protein